MVWRRLPGLTQFSLTGQTGYRGGIEAGGISYEAFAGQAVTLTSGGAATNLGAFPGVDAISIAENQNATSPDVVAVDPIQGAYVLNSAILDATLTLALVGTSNAGDTVSIDFTNPAETLAGTWPMTGDGDLGRARCWRHGDRGRHRFGDGHQCQCGAVGR